MSASLQSPAATNTRVDATLLSPPEAARARLATLTASVGGYLEASKAPSTRRAYRSDQATFSLWCHEHQRGALPASDETVALYLAAMADAGAKASTIQRHLSSISVIHQMAGEENPTRSSLVRTAMAGIRRTLGTRPRQVAALRLATLRKLLEATPEESAAGVRDRAVLLLGFAGAFRRSELAALDLADLVAVDEGLRITVRSGKTDPTREGREIGIPRGRHPLTCPVTAVLRWITVAGLEDGALFRRVDKRDQVLPGRLAGEAIATIVQRAAARAGLDPSDYAGHSLRSGFATEAGAKGIPERAIMRHTGHRSERILRTYIRAGSLFDDDNAAGRVGL